VGDEDLNAGDEEGEEGDEREPVCDADEGGVTWSLRIRCRSHDRTSLRAEGVSGCE
jgi:hypothetical protein